MNLMPILRLTTIMVHVSGRITFGALSPARNLLTFAIIHAVVVCQSQSHISKVSNIAKTALTPVIPKCAICKISIWSGRLEGFESNTMTEQ